jgi:hypothetical protein
VTPEEAAVNAISMLFAVCLGLVALGQQPATTATVTTPAAINFSDQYIRTRADMLAKEYNGSIVLVARWNSLGGGQPATNVMAADIQKMCRFMLDNQTASFMNGENEWLGQGSAVIVAGGGTIMDSAGQGIDKSRPVITADQAITIVTHWRERTNWLAAGAPTWASTTPLSTGGANGSTLILCFYNPTAANCGTAITRFTELQTQYEANSKAVINSILQVAVNPSYP